LSPSLQIQAADGLLEPRVLGRAGHCARVFDQRQVALVDEPLDDALETMGVAPWLEALVRHASKHGEQVREDCLAQTDGVPFRGDRDGVPELPARELGTNRIGRLQVIPHLREILCGHAAASKHEILEHGLGHGARCLK